MTKDIQHDMTRQGAKVKQTGTQQTNKQDKRQAPANKTLEKQQNNDNNVPQAMMQLLSCLLQESQLVE